jgi:ribosomal-protein-alanine acetyltransferase
LSDVEKINNWALEIRQMQQSDLSEVMRQERMIFSDPWPRSAFTDLLANEDWDGLVAGIDGELVGYACYLIVAQECHLANIAVHPAYRRKSVAKQLLFHILEVAATRDCEMVLLEVRVSNEEAIAFYQRFGFYELYRRRQYYRFPQEDAIVMVRNLKDNPPEIS